ncbi:MAG: hypothetical protein Q9228_007763, partial [Teloschistes exilis]
MSSMTPIGFLDLPFDIRHYLYRMVFPRPDISKGRGEWMEIVGRPNEYMNLLLVNRQIYEEGSAVIHDNSAFTISVSATMTFINSKHVANLISPFPTMACLQYIRDWQLDLQFLPPYDGRYLTVERLPHLDTPLASDQYYIREAILAASVVLWKECRHLETLKIRAPCLCNMFETATPQAIHKAIVFALEPLQLLRFRRSVKVMTVQSTVQLETGLP